MSKKDSRWPFSIVSNKKIKLKDSIEELKKVSWIKYVVVIMFSMLLGAGLAFYQYSNSQITDYQFLSSGTGETKSEVEMRGFKEDKSSYKLDKEELELPKEIEIVEKKQSNSKEVVNENTNQKTNQKQAIRVTSDKVSTRGQFGNLIKPVDGQIIISWQEPYRDKIIEAWKFNSGVDIKAQIGTGVKAAESGRVEKVIRDDYQGVTIIIKHNSRFKTLYSYLQKSYLQEGEQVAKGQKIGEVGDSGLNNESKLHFEVIEVEGQQSKRVPPVKYFN